MGFPKAFWVLRTAHFFEECTRICVLLAKIDFFYITIIYLYISILYVYYTYIMNTTLYST